MRYVDEIETLMRLRQVIAEAGEEASELVDTLRGSEEFEEQSGNRTTANELRKARAMTEVAQTFTHTTTAALDSAERKLRRLLREEAL